MESAGLAMACRALTLEFPFPQQQRHEILGLTRSGAIPAMPCACKNCVRPHRAMCWLPFTGLGPLHSDMHDLLLGKNVSTPALLLALWARCPLGVSFGVLNVHHVGVAEHH